jgi:transposase
MKNRENNPVPMNLRPTTLTMNERFNKAKNQSAKVYDPAIRKLRRQQIVMSKVLGLTNTHIGEIFGLSKATVSHEITMAKKDGTLEALNARVLDELVPDAIAVYKRKLTQEDDAFVAKDVLKHLERLTNRKDEQQKQQNMQYSMDAYIKAKRELPNGDVLHLEQRIQGEAAKVMLETGSLEPAPASNMDFLEGIVVETIDDKD